MHQPVQTYCPALDIVPLPRNLEGSFGTCVEYGAHCRSRRNDGTRQNFVARMRRGSNIHKIALCRIWQKKIRNQRTINWSDREWRIRKQLLFERKPLLFGREIAALIVIGYPKTSSRNDRQPAEIGVRIRQLMERVQANGA